MRVVAVDPGKMTGVAEYTGEFQSFELPCWEAVEWVDDALAGETVTHLVVEEFIISQRTLKLTRGENWSLESIGALRYLAAGSGYLDEFFVQKRDALRFSTDAKLRLLGWYRPSRGGHANDAARHLLKYVVDRKLDPDLTARLAGVTGS